MVGGRERTARRFVLDPRPIGLSHGREPLNQSGGRLQGLQFCSFADIAHAPSAAIAQGLAPSDGRAQSLLTQASVIQAHKPTSLAPSTQRTKNATLCGAVQAKPSRHGGIRIQLQGDNGRNMSYCWLIGRYCFDFHVYGTSAKVETSNNTRPRILFNFSSHILAQFPK
ncbi:hypothetical protein CCHR01_16616 [Colletotrichum chrysophilum]|uniref:Uncharacterized protein n=1 Tax=Colletotrichum chrysophilum TaxID=1836956 RepID=A0AAD9EDA9_9PEZI|nr:hypothetical protein CCHR01_16616 [Colletotrichum chrysophilum]